MLEKDRLHHAYLFEGDTAAALAHIEAFFRDAYSIERRGNPDFWYSEHDSFGIDDSRMISDRHSEKSFGEKKIFALSVRSMTREAQNALLKTLEEPTPDTHFFILASSRSIFLPTLLSRLSVITHGRHDVSGAAEAAKDFFSQSYKDRMEYAKELAEEGDRAKAKDFLIAVLGELRARRHSDLPHESESAIVEGISYLSDRSSSIKLILESAALSLPQAA